MVFLLFKFPLNFLNLIWSGLPNLPLSANLTNRRNFDLYVSDIAGVWFGNIPFYLVMVPAVVPIIFLLGLIWRDFTKLRMIFGRPQNLSCLLSGGGSMLIPTTPSVTISKSTNPVLPSIAPSYDQPGKIRSFCTYNGEIFSGGKLMNIGTPIERKEVELAKKESMMRPSEQQNLVETVKTIGNQINFCKVEEIAKSSPNSISNWVVGPDRQLVTKTSALLSHYTRNGTSNQQIGAELFKLRLTTHVNAIKLSPILKSSGLVFPKETNFDEFIRENSSLQWFLASNTLDIFGTDGSKGIKFVGIVPGGPNLGDLSLILVDKRTGKCAEMVVDLTSGVNPTETMDLKLQTLQNQFNSKYSWSNKESLRDYGPRKQPRLYPLIDKSELESSGKLGLRLYEIDLYETGKPRLIHSGDLSNHLQNHPRINYVRPSDLMFVDHQGYCRTMLGKPIYDSKSLVTPLTTKGLLGSIPDFLSFF